MESDRLRLGVVARHLHRLMDFCHVKWLNSQECGASALRCLACAVWCRCRMSRPRRPPPRRAPASLRTLRLYHRIEHPITRSYQRQSPDLSPPHPTACCSYTVLTHGSLQTSGGGMAWEKCERLAHEPTGAAPSALIGASAAAAPDTSIPLGGGAAAALGTPSPSRPRMRGDARTPAERGRWRLGGAGPRPHARAEATSGTPASLAAVAAAAAAEVVAAHCARRGKDWPMG